MSEDWSGIAAEVTEALKSVSDVNQPNGYPAALRKPGAPSGDPYDPTPGAATYATVWCVETRREVRDQTGTAIIRVERVLLVSATEGVTTSDNDHIAPGIEAGAVDAGTLWEEIEDVKPLSPAGITVMFEVVLSGTQTKLAFEE